MHTSELLSEASLLHSYTPFKIEFLYSLKIALLSKKTKDS